MKKKFIAVFTLAAMTLAFTGCGDSKEETTREKTTAEVTNEATAEVTTEDVADTTEEITTEADNTSTESNSTSVTAERGTIEDGVFTNNTFKVSFPINDDMTVYTDEQVLSLLGLSQNLIADNGLYTAEQLEESLSGTMYDIIFAFPDGQSNVSVSYVNLEKSGMASGISLDLYASACISQLEQMTSPKYTFDETTKETYGGLEYTCLNANTDQVYSQKMLMRSEGNYIVLITLTYITSTPELATDFLNSLLPVQ